MAGPGGSSWDTATPLPVGDTSSTALADLPEGTDFPYQSAWWVITPDADLPLIIDSEQTSAASGSTVDTYLTVYTGADYASAVEVGSNDDGGDVSLSSKLDITLSAGVTYHVRLGTFGGYSGTLVLRTTPYVFSDWVQAPNVYRTQAYASRKEGLDTAGAEITGSATFELSKVNQALTAATVPVGAWYDLSNTGETTFGPDVHGSNYLQNGVFHYIGRAFNQAVRMHLVQPSIYFSEGDFSPPAGSLGIELASNEGQVLDGGINYSLQNGSYFATGGSRFPLSGRWSHTLTMPHGSVNFLGGNGDPEGASLGSGSMQVLPADAGPDGSILVAASLDFGSASVPANTSSAFADDYMVAASWTCEVYYTIQPPLYRYKMAVTTSTGTLRVPPLRLHPRSDGRGMSSAQRVWPRPPTGAYGRIGPGSLI